MKNFRNFSRISCNASLPDKERDWRIKSLSNTAYTTRCLCVDLQLRRLQMRCAWSSESLIWKIE